jgi:WD40 repeat protein
LVAAASMDGSISVWDLKSYGLRTTLRHGDDGAKCGVTHMAWHPTEPLIFSASLDKSVVLTAFHNTTVVDILSMNH